MKKSASTAALLLSVLAGFLAPLRLLGQTTITLVDGQPEYTDVRTTTVADPLTLTIADGGTATQSGPIGGDGSLTKTGAGSILLTGTNTYIGGTVVDAGILVIDNDGATTFGTLGSGSTTVNGDGGSGLAGTLQFLTSSSAGSGAFTITGSTTNGGYGGGVEFHDSSTAGSGTFAANGATAGGTSGGDVVFFGSSSAGSATLIANGSANANAGGSIYFIDDSLGGTAAVKVYDNGFLDISLHHSGVIVGSLEGTGQVFLGTNNLSIGSNNADTTFSGVVQDGSFGAGGSLTKIGTGTLILSGVNTYTGGTTVSEGTLQLGDGGTSGSVTGDITDNASLVFNRSDALTYAGIVSGSGSITQSGTGTLILSGANTHTGGTTITAGTLQLGDGGTSGSVAGDITDNASLVFNRSDAVTYAGVISGSGSLAQAGTGTLTLSGLNTYTGATRVSAGTLALAADNLLSASTTLELTGGKLDLGGHAQTFASLGGAASGLVGNITAGTITTDGDTYLTSGTYANGWTGTGRLYIGGNSSATVTLNGTNDSVTADHDQVIIGSSATGAAGVVKLGNANALAAATENAHLWAGVLNLNGQANVRANSLVIENGNTSALVNLSTASTASFAGDVTLVNGMVQIGGNGDIALSGPVSGAGGFIKTSSGTLTLSASNHTYTGDTDILAGALVISGTLASGDYHGSIANSGSLTLSAPSADQALAGIISGSGSLTKSGTGTLTLSATNTYTGTTTVSGGLVNFSNSANFGTGRITFDGGGLQWAPGNTADISSRLNALGAGGATFDTNGNAVTLASALTGSGGLTKSGSGTLTLTGANTYSGGTLLNAGTLALGSDNAISSGPLTITGGTLRASGNQRTLANDVVLSGDFTLGRLTNLAGSITLTRDVTITSANPDTAGATTSTLSGVISGAHGLTFTEGSNPIGTIVLTGNNTYTGGTTIAAGKIIFSSLANFGTGAITLNGGALQWASGNTADISSHFAALGAGGATFDTGGNDVTFASALSGAGSLTKTGSGTLSLSGISAYSGGTTINGGTLALGASNVLADTGDLTLNYGTFTLGSFDQTVGVFTLASGFVSGSGTLIASSFAVQSGSISATLAGTGVLTKTGDGVVVLSAANTYSGGTTINGGLVNFSSLANLGTGTITLNGGGLQWASGNTTDITAASQFNRVLGADGATFDTNGNDVTFASALSGSGSLTKAGSGTLTLSGTNTYSGGTTINAGFVAFSSLASFGTGAITLNSGGLQWTSGNTADLSSRLTLGANYTTLDTNGNDVTFTSSLSGSTIVTSYYGSTYTNYSYLNKAGAGTLTLSGATNIQEIDITGGTVVFTAGAYESDLTIGDQQLGNSLLATPTAAILSGPGVTLASANYIAVGYSNEGPASLALSAGATATTTDSYIGYGGIGASTLTVSDAGSTFTTGNLYVGYGNQDRASLTVSGDATVAATSTYIGFYGPGEMTLSGADSKFTNTGTLSLAYNAADHGTLNLGSAASDAATAAGILDAATVTGGAGTAILQFNTTGTNLAPTYFTRDGTSTGTGVNTAGSLSLVNTAGVTVLSGTGTQTGATLINGGTLVATQLANGGSASSIGQSSSAATNLVLNGGALRYAGAAQSTDRLFQVGGTTAGGTGTVDASGTGALNFTNAGNLAYGTSNQTRILGLTGTNTGANTLAALIADNGTGAVSVAKSGAGTWVLTGSNTYTGGTTITGGKLVVDGSIANSATTINNGGTLGGHGTVGALTLASGGTLAPGNSPGTLSAGNTTFAGGGTFQFEVNNATGSAGTNYDLLAVSDILTLTATSADPFKLDVTSLTLGNAAGPATNFDATANYSFTFLTTTGGITGFSADAFAIGTTNFQNPFTGTWSVSSTNSGRDLTLNYTGQAAVPEPSTYAALAGLVALGLAMWRRRSSSDSHWRSSLRVRH